MTKKQRECRALALIDRAIWCVDHGISVLPVKEDKAPALPSWSHLNKRPPTKQEVERWWEYGGNNIAIICGEASGLVCMDFDTDEEAEKALLVLPSNSMISKTPRGLHYWCRITGRQDVKPRVKLAGLPIDIRGNNSYAVIPPSTCYEQIGDWDLANVPVFDPAWLSELAPGLQSQNTHFGRDADSFGRQIRNITAYLRKIESVEGQGGNRGLVRAIAICRDGGLSPAECMAEILEWNQGPTVAPPWSNREIARAITNLYARE